MVTEVDKICVTPAIMNICRGHNLINSYDKLFKQQDLERKLLLPERSPSIPRKASKESFKVQFIITLCSVYFKAMLKCFCLE